MGPEVAHVEAVQYGKQKYLLPSQMTLCKNILT